MDRVGALMASIPLTLNANERYLGMTLEALVDWAVAELLKARAARVEDGVLVDA